MDYYNAALIPILHEKTKTMPPPTTTGMKRMIKDIDCYGKPFFGETVTVKLRWLVEG